MPIACILLPIFTDCYIYAIWDGCIMDTIERLSYSACVIEFSTLVMIAGIACVVSVLVEIVVMTMLR